MDDGKSLQNMFKTVLIILRKAFDERILLTKTLIKQKLERIQAGGRLNAPKVHKQDTLPCKPGDDGLMYSNCSNNNDVDFQLKI